MPLINIDTKYKVSVNRQFWPLCYIKCTKTHIPDIKHIISYLPPPSLVNPPPVTRTYHGLVSIIMSIQSCNIVQVYIYVHGGDYRTCTRFVSYRANLCIEVSCKYSSNPVIVCLLRSCRIVKLWDAET